MSFRTAALTPEARRRLWEVLFDEAEARGADGFSIQPDATFASSPGGPGPEALLAHLPEVRPRWRWSLRPPAWPIDDQARLWLRRLGSQVFRVTVWVGKRWVVRTDLWGRWMTAVVPLDALDGLRERLRVALGGLPDHSIQTWRSLQPSEAGGWAVPRRWRWAIVGAGVVLALVLGPLLDWEAGVGALFVSVAIAFALPQHEPSGLARLFVRTGSLGDPGFQRLVQRTFPFGVGGVVLLGIATGGVAVSEPGSAWRVGFVVLLGVAIVLSLAGLVPPTLWLWRRRGRAVDEGRGLP